MSFEKWIFLSISMEQNNDQKKENHYEYIFGMMLVCALAQQTKHLNNN